MRLVTIRFHRPKFTGFSRLRKRLCRKLWRLTLSGARLEHLEALESERRALKLSFDTIIRIPTKSHNSRSDFFEIRNTGDVLEMVGIKRKEVLRNTNFGKEEHVEVTETILSLVSQTRHKKDDILGIILYIQSNRIDDYLELCDLFESLVSLNNELLKVSPEVSKFN